MGKNLSYKYFVAFSKENKQARKWTNRHHATMQPVKQATKQLSNQATKQPSNQATKQPSNQATMQPCNHASKQATNQPTIYVISD